MSSRIIRVPAGAAWQVYQWDHVAADPGKRAHPSPASAPAEDTARLQREVEARLQAEREQAYRQGEAAGRHAALQQLESELLRLARAVEEVSGYKKRLRAQAEALRASEAQTIVVTLGGRGALAVTGGEALHVPGRSVKAVDTTGAGDCFVGALAVALSETQPLRAALDFANRAASISVQRLGAATSMPQRAEVDQVK